MITFLLICNFIQLFAIIFLIRFIWYLVSYGAYINLIKIYVLENNITDQDLIVNFYQIWPISSIMVRFWNFNLRDFIYHQDLYDKILEYFESK